MLVYEGKIVVKLAILLEILLLLSASCDISYVFFFNLPTNYWVKTSLKRFKHR